MPELTMGPREEAFLISEANGFRSRDAIALKQSNAVYQPGSVVVSLAGKYELATATNLDDGDDGLAGDVAIVARYNDATLGDVIAAAITNDAEVKNSDLVLDASINVNDVAPLLAAKGIKVRETI
ncbi:head decoration protein [Pseudochrobactrum asaccharolyticum]|uniref:head decoration protein n=1 Tax=Pseudochrobactrum asaccharolyticum TaxID=354351 RepID=UPI0040434301